MKGDSAAAPARGWNFKSSICLCIRSSADLLKFNIYIYIQIGVVVVVVVVVVVIC